MTNPRKLENNTACPQNNCFLVQPCSAWTLSKIPVRTVTFIPPSLSAGMPKRKQRPWRLKDFPEFTQLVSGWGGIKSNWSNTKAWADNDRTHFN